MILPYTYQWWNILFLSWLSFDIVGTAQEMKFSIKDFFSKCDQIRRKLRIWSHLLKISLIENFFFLCNEGNLGQSETPGQSETIYISLIIFLRQQPWNSWVSILYKPCRRMFVMVDLKVRSIKQKKVKVEACQVRVVFRNVFGNFFENI